MCACVYVCFHFTVLAASDDDLAATNLFHGVVVNGSSDGDKPWSQLPGGGIGGFANILWHGNRKTDGEEWSAAARAGKLVAAC